jgi:hypothetical protein
LTKRSVKILAIFTLLACGPGMADMDDFMSFFMPESSNAPAYAEKYHYTSNLLYNDNELESSNDTIDLCKVENVAAWQKYCQDKLSTKDIETGIYGKFTGSKLEKYLSNNDLAKNYILLAKEIDDDFEKSMTVAYGEPTNYVSQTPILEKKASDLLATAKQKKDDFVTERLAFQLVRFAGVNKNHQEAIDRFAQLITPIKQKTFISDWALMRKAEAETSLGNKAEAYYDFAQVFDRSASHRFQADNLARFRLDSMEIDNEVLKFCKNGHEKAVVYAFAGIKPFMDALPMLEKMVEIDPQNLLTEMIMAREINKNEAFYYEQNGMWFYEEDSTKKQKKQEIATDYWTKLKEFSVKCAENPKLPKTGFWQITSAYMEYVGGDYAKSEVFLSQAKAVNSSNKGLQNQILIQELLLSSKKSKEITPELEMTYLPILEKIGKPNDFRLSNAIQESCKILAAKYRGIQPVAAEKNGGFLSSCSNKKPEKMPVTIPNAEAKAYLLTMLTTYQVNSSNEYGGYESQKDMFPIEDTTSLATVEKVIQYFTNPNKTDFDKRLQKLTGFDNDHLYTLMGRRAMDEHQYAKAAEAFGKVNPKVWQAEVWKTMFNEDPFFIATKYGEEKPNPYNPYTFAKKLADLESKLKGNPNDGESAYLLGCAALNTTTHGNSWILRRHGWSNNDVSSYYKRNYDLDYYQATKAKDFFITAMKSQNVEIAAKACFGAARCEQIAFEVLVNSQESDLNESVEKRNERLEDLRGSKHTTYFKLLKTKYQNTQYEKQVLAECGDYTLFMGE